MSRVVLAALLLACAIATPILAEPPYAPTPVLAPPSPAIVAAVGAPDRPAADVARDAQRHPAELIAFAGIKPGDQVADFMPGAGYFSRIFSHVVGKTGHVYAIVPDFMMKLMPARVKAVQAMAAEPPYGNISVRVDPVGSVAKGLALDAVWTSDNYHDVYGFFGPQAAADLDAAVFRALKPGGVFLVIDHEAVSGTSETAPKTLHRIDPKTVIAQVLAAGFQLEAESTLLRNAADPHTAKVFDPAVRGHTDQFVYKFRKPEAK